MYRLTSSGSVARTPRILIDCLPTLPVSAMSLWICCNLGKHSELASNKSLRGGRVTAIAFRRVRHSCHSTFNRPRLFLTEWESQYPFAGM